VKTIKEIEKGTHYLLPHIKTFYPVTVFWYLGAWN